MTGIRDALVVQHGNLSGFPFLSACLPVPSRFSFCRFTIGPSFRRRHRRAQQGLRPSRPMGAGGTPAHAMAEVRPGLCTEPSLRCFLLQIAAAVCPCFLLARGDGLLRRPSFVSVAACHPTAQPATASTGPQDSAPSELNLGKPPTAGQMFTLFSPIYLVAPWDNEAVPRLVSAV